jgi:phosphatidylserine decarboxylase
MSDESKSLASAPAASSLSAEGAGGYPHPIIAREGWPFIMAGAVAAAAVHWEFGGWWASPLWLLVAFMVQFFRDPPRRVPGEPRAVLSPADGRIVAVEKSHDPYLERDAIKMSVFMNVFDVHSNRSPVDGEVRNTWYHIGKFFNAALSKSSLENERAALWIRTPGGADVTCVQIAGLVARRILCYARSGQRLARGQRFGFIRFGSRVDLYLPAGTRLVASVGDKVYATESVLAVLPA